LDSLPDAMTNAWCRVLSLRADQMLKKLKAARLDQTLELRKLVNDQPEHL
jgi:hypothetical protein